MSDPIDDVLQRYFDDVRQHDRLGDTPVRVVMRRGNRRKARRRTGVMAGTLVVGALGSAFAVRALGNGDSRRSVQVGNEGSVGTDGNPAPDVAGGTGSAASSGLVWNETLVGSAEALAIAWSGDVVGTAATGYYAVSTDPGRNETTTATLYRSTDGLHWKPAGAPPDHLGNPSRLALAADRLYAVGTIASKAQSRADEPGTPVLTSSADGGATWNDHELPIDLDAIRRLPDVRAVTLSTSVAGGDAGVLVAGVTHAQIDVAQIAPEGVDPSTLMPEPSAGGLARYEVTDVGCSDPEGAGMETATTVAPDAADATTTAVTTSETAVPGFPGATSCQSYGALAGTYTFTELGVGEPTATAQMGQLHLLASADGSTFTPVSAPELPAGWYVQHALVRRTPDGYALLVSLLQTDLGTATTGGAEVRQQTLAYTSADGSAWAPIADVPVPWVDTIDTLADGTLAVAGSDGVGPMFGVLRDGTWHTTRTIDLVGGSAPLGFAPSAQSIGPFGFAAVVQTGDAVSQDHPVPDTANAGVPTTALGIDSSTARSLLVTSRDGVTWAVDDIDDVIGPDRYVEAVRQMDDQVIVHLGSASGYSSEPDAPLPDRTVLIGTPGG